MNWERLIVGPRGRGLGRWRWPLGTVLGLAIAVFGALGDDWVTFGIGLAAAALAGALAISSFTRANER